MRLNRTALISLLRMSMAQSAAKCTVVAFTHESGPDADLTTRPTMLVTLGAQQVARDREGEVWGGVNLITYDLRSGLFYGLSVQNCSSNEEKVTRYTALK